MNQKLNPTSRRIDEMRKVIQFPSWLETRTTFQVERLLEFVLKVKNQEQIKRAIILSENQQLPEDWPGSNHLQDATLVERIILNFIRKQSQRQNDVNALQRIESMLSNAEQKQKTATKNGGNKSAKTRKEKSEAHRKVFNEFYREYRKTKIEEPPLSQIIAAYRKKHPDAPKSQSTYSQYLK